jgi:NAD(P)-dependent dehydrogenase (short-subunit alcohol dehydrogenase family)
VAGALEGKVVVVTGSTRGIGRAIAVACAAEGASVVVNGRAEGPVDEAAAAIRASGGEATGVVADVSHADDVQRLFDAALGAYGRIDVWFNNAGLPGGFRPLHEMPAADLTDIADVNFGGFMLCCRLAIPYMREHGGIIVNMCGRGSRGEVAAYGAPYAASKAADASLTMSLAAENRDAPNLSIVGLIPGMVPTDFYAKMECSPALEEKRANVDIALDAFKVMPEEVGAYAVKLAATAPGSGTGKMHTLLGGMRSMRGVLKIMGARMSGRMKPL